MPCQTAEGSLQMSGSKFLHKSTVIPLLKIHASSNPGGGRGGATAGWRGKKRVSKEEEDDLLPRSGEFLPAFACRTRTLVNAQTTQADVRLQ